MDTGSAVEIHRQGIQYVVCVQGMIFSKLLTYVHTTHVQSYVSTVHTYVNMFCLCKHVGVCTAIRTFIGQ